MSRIPCQDCCRRRYDMVTGDPMLASDPEDEVKVYYTLENGGYTGPPCRTGEKCPKESPEKAILYDLHPLTASIYLRWRQNHAMHSKPLTAEEMDDDLLMECYERCAALTEHSDGVQDTRRQYELLTAVLPKKPTK